MKKFTLCSLLLLSSVIFWRCEDDFQSSMKLGDFSFMLDTTTWKVPVDGGRDYRVIEAPGDWTVKIQYPEGTTDKWVKISDTTGSFGKYKLTLVAGANTSYEFAREASLIFSSGEQTETMRIYQPTPIGAVVKQDTYNVEAGDTVIKVEFTVNVPYDYSISDNAQKWIIPVLGKAVDNVTLQFQILASNRSRERVGTITIYPEGGEAVPVTVTQAGASELIEYPIYEETDLRGNVSFVKNSDGSMDAWFLRSTPMKFQSEPHMYNGTGWWYAITNHVPKQNEKHFGTDRYDLGDGPVALKFYASTAFNQLCYMGSGTCSFTLYPWDTDYATSIAKTPVFKKNMTYDGGWAYATGAGEYLPAGNYLAVLEGSAGNIVMVTPNEADDEVWAYANGASYNKFISLSYEVYFQNPGVPFDDFNAYDFSAMVKAHSADGQSWDEPEFVFTANNAMLSQQDNLGYANNMAIAKVGSDYFMALSHDENGIWMAKSANGKDNWEILGDKSILESGKVVSMFINDAMIYLYFQVGSDIHVATTSAGSSDWYTTLKDNGSVLTVPSGVGGVSVVYNANISKYQILYSQSDVISSYVADAGTDKFEAGDIVVDGTRAGATQVGYFTNEAGIVPDEAKTWVGYQYSQGLIAMPL